MVAAEILKESRFLSEWMKFLILEKRLEAIARRSADLLDRERGA
jgi:hypothetical protein